MPQTFTIFNKLLSLRGRMIVSRTDGTAIASVMRKPWVWRQTWNIEVGTAGLRLRLRRKVLSLMRRWLVDGDLGEFSLARKFALRRRYRVRGGPFDGAELKGNFTDLKMDVSWKGGLLIRSTGQLLTLRDHHTIEVFDDSPQALAFAVTAMVAVLADRRTARAQEEEI